jgi:hypothetical protein
VLFPFTIGVFVYFNVGSNALWAFLPLLVLMQVIRSQAVKISNLEKDVMELKDLV